MQVFFVVLEPVKLNLLEASEVRMLYLGASWKLTSPKSGCGPLDQEILR
jgi:hypothetical protein